MRYRGGKFPIDPEGISSADMKFVDAFHKPVKPVGYEIINHPIVNDTSRIFAFV
jgi:hypothetical protein